MPPHNGQQPPRYNHLAWRVLATALLYALAYLRRGEGVRLGIEGARLRVWSIQTGGGVPIARPEAVEGVAFCVLLLVGGSCGGRWSVLVSGVVGGVAVVAACVAVCGSSEQEKYKYTTKKLYKNLVV